MSWAGTWLWAMLINHPHVWASSIALPMIDNNLRSQYQLTSKSWCLMHWPAQISPEAWFCFHPSCSYCHAPPCVGYFSNTHTGYGLSGWWTLDFFPQAGASLPWQFSRCQNSCANHLAALNMTTMIQWHEAPPRTEALQLDTYRPPCPWYIHMTPYM